MFKYDKHSSQGKDERLDWVISQIKDKNIIGDITLMQTIDSLLAELRLSYNTKKDYKEQILSEIRK